MAKNHNATFELAKEDVSNVLHPNLWHELLETYNIEPDAETITIQLSKQDDNNSDPRGD